MDAKIAVIVDDGHQDREFWYPKTRLEEEGADVDVVTRKDRTYESEHGYEVDPDKTIQEIDSSRYDAVVIPGGRASPDALRTDERVLEFVSDMDDEDKVVAAICHAPWVLVSAGVLEGREATCYHSIKDDVENAGAEYRDEEVVVSDNLVTSRHPGDLTEWVPKIIEMVG